MKQCYYLFLIDEFNSLVDERRFVSCLTNRQIQLMYGQKFSYVRHYISWLCQNGKDLFSIAYFVRNSDSSPLSMSNSRFLNLAKSRFIHKLENDFLVDLTFDEFQWLCASYYNFV